MQSGAPSCARRRPVSGHVIWPEPTSAGSGREEGLQPGSFSHLNVVQDLSEGTQPDLTKQVRVEGNRHGDSQGRPVSVSFLLGVEDSEQLPGSCVPAAAESCPSAARPAPQNPPPLCWRREHCARRCYTQSVDGGKTAALS